MSRSKKKNPIVKDKGWEKKSYWKKVRRNWKQNLHMNWDDPDIQFDNPKTIVNDWDYCDWRYVCYPHVQRNNPFYGGGGIRTMYLINEETVKKYYRK